MGLKITACTDKAFVHAALPLAHIEMRAASAANDNAVLPQARPATHLRRLRPSLLASDVVQRAARVLLYASQRGHPRAAAQATKLIASLRLPSPARTKVNIRDILKRARFVELRPETRSGPAPTSSSPLPQAYTAAGSQSPSSVGRSLSAKAPLYWF